MTMRKVLIPTDGSDFSRQILPHVRRFLDPENHELIMLRVAPTPSGLISAAPQPVSMAWTAPMYRSARDVEHARHPIYASQEWDSLQATLASELQSDVQTMQSLGYNVSVAVRFGDAADEIVRFAEDAQVDILAMATHGRTGLLQLVLGSVAEKVIHHLTLPVLLVRPLN